MIEDYEQITRKILIYFGWCNLLKDPDIFGDFVTEVMIADWKFDGRGTLHGYRYQRVLWKLLTMIRNRKNKTKQYVLDRDKICFLVDNNRYRELRT